MEIDHCLEEKQHSGLQSGKQIKQRFSVTKGLEWNLCNLMEEKGGTVTGFIKHKGKLSK